MFAVRGWFAFGLVVVAVCGAGRAQEVRRAVSVEQAGPSVRVVPEEQAERSVAVGQEVPVGGEVPVARALPVGGEVPVVRAVPVGAEAAVVVVDSGGELAGEGERKAVENDLAQFLAGIRLPATSPLAVLQESAEYGEHSHALGQLWRRYNERYFLPMRLWSEITLAPRIDPGLPVFYFFGGPDVLGVMALFPVAPYYLLGGLEGVGEAASPLSLDGAEVHASLAALRQSVEVVLSYGHFITGDMKEDLDRGAFRGVLPLVLTFVALSGGEVLEASYVAVGRGGVLRDLGAAFFDPPGVRVVFRRAAGAGPQTIYYVRANVANDGLKTNPSALEWAGGFGNGNSYLKAASYLMHEPGFSRVREFILGNSRAILQDDSGIPVRYFKPEAWALEFFGTYAGTLDIFKKYEQPALGEIFSSPGIAPLPFGTGYKWRRGESNLMLAVRTPDRPAGEGMDAPGH
jgi:hypothetical protein